VSFLDAGAKAQSFLARLDVRAKARTYPSCPEATTSMKPGSVQIQCAGLETRTTAGLETGATTALGATGEMR
jgi:hypothetical protein